MIYGGGESGAQVGRVQDIFSDRDAAGAQTVGEARGKGYVETNLPQLLDVPEDLGGWTVEDYMPCIHDNDPLEEYGLVHGVGNVHDAHVLAEAQLPYGRDQTHRDRHRQQ